MDLSRPDLSGASPEVREYIAYLEEQIRVLIDSQSLQSVENGEYLASSEPVGPYQIIIATSSGIAKRTPLHLYPRQRRGGMGIFDLDADADDPPAILSVVEETQTLLLVTNYSRAFRLSLSSFVETQIHAKGATIFSRIALMDEERLAAVLPIQAQGYLALLSQTGMVRCLRHHVFGEYMKPGIPLYDIKSFGPLVSAAWTPGDGDLLIATSQGRAIRFSEKQVPPQGCLGIRLAANDYAVAIAPVYEDSEVFMLGADGRGTIRQMPGFAANKAPGSGGKNAMGTSRLVAAVNVDEVKDIFIISRLSKIIRFDVAEVPVKDGVVQGVNCMNYRSDEAVAVSVFKSAALM